jgi:hypothetical protein
MSNEGSEALLGLLSRVFEVDEDIDGLVYLDIQKIFYYLRERLDEDNEVRELLPYYWYIDGVVSDTVQGTVNLGRESGVLATEATYGTGNGEWFERREEYTPSSLQVDREDYRDAEEALEVVLEEDYNVFSGYEEKLDDIYSRAPYDFQSYYKFEVLAEIGLFAQGKPWAYPPEKLQSLVSTAEAYLPLTTAFEDFNSVFSRYVNVSKQYFEAVDEEERALADRFNQLSENIWRLYCQRLRIEEHDPYYESKLELWEERYDRTEKLVISDIREFRQLVETEFETNTTSHKSSEDSAWGKIAYDYVRNSEADD